ncbi:c-type cytochrome biogenesis protein CcsB [Cellulomonas wangsupingiae]|uniref:C-type cytochrome biogenesis protein CcsB n=1 Tax=Cellulomonas wangsupingiae TaxID=2968085 RepID=A0ABY5K5D3_9CELL|nr:c-type cytochrome biogenesis protein CcsB [Cellulomonas wangsupingiae]MCC2335563.1 c-type cytochrome biogenesis protein CcsB [Cellulomonas wangsupingiae]MCM0641497.1 c-type cytochrome biogenesis protein CcsB [Cellulomonas wangsupingiae]UUI64270.1 c-type cytochrome biogenesis protein CcsB [Cellulomonas wangsupingiae]
MNVAELSDLFVWSAATALTIALVAYAVDLARVAEVARAAREVREPVAVGGPSAAPAAAVTPGAPVRGKAAGIAWSTLVLGTLLLLVAIVLRGVAAGRWPTANMYEFTIVGTFCAAAVLVVVQRRRPIAFVGVVVTGMSVLALVLALNTLHVQADAVQPALQRYWLVIHVGVAILATGVFTVAFATAALQVLRESRDEGRSRLDRPWSKADGVRQAFAGARVTGPAFAWLEQVPDARRLEAMSFRLHAVGFVLWTFTLIGGAIWAEEAWGRFWGWDPKEVGTFVAWVVYAAYLHARTTRGWTGRRAAYIAFVGYAAVIANFTVVNLFVDGLHSYSGL